MVKVPVVDRAYRNYRKRMVELGLLKVERKLSIVDGNFVNHILRKTERLSRALEDY